MGRVETTSKTDKHQIHEPRNDDNVSLRQLPGGGCIIIETDGAGSGGKSSAVLSYELNKNCNEGLTRNFLKLESLCLEYSQAPEEGKEAIKKNLETLVKSIAKEALDKATASVLAQDPSRKEATTLSLVMALPIPGKATMTFGLQYHDSVSVLWNPSTGKFDSDSFRISDGASQIGVSPQSKARQRIIDKSEFFINQFEGNRIAMAFSDGVWDNLPTTAENHEGPESGPGRLEILNDIML